MNVAYTCDLDPRDTDTDFVNSGESQKAGRSENFAVRKSEIGTIPHFLLLLLPSVTGSRGGEGKRRKGGIYTSGATIKTRAAHFHTRSRSLCRSSVHECAIKQRNYQGLCS